MKTHKKLHESKEVANRHIAKIKERGGNVKQSIKDGKILLEYSFKNEIVVYHGTDVLFKKFDKTKATDGNYSDGFYFTNKIEKAKEYGKVILKCRLFGDNILIIDNDTTTLKFINDVFSITGIKYDNNRKAWFGLKRELVSDNYKNILEEMGYDLIIANTIYQTEYVVFNNKNVDIISVLS